MTTVEITQQTKAMIDGLKAVCTNFGLGNAASEYKIITEVFLYKFLNDKFIYEMKKVNPAYADLTDTEVEQRLSALSEDEYEMALMDIGGSTAKLHPKQFISYLFNHQNDDKFHDLFDKTLVAISNDNMDIFSVQAGGASKIKLFDALSPYVIEEEKRDAFCKAMIGKLVNDSFTGVFEQKYDFFADIFEYLIKDYNKDSGKYAEYYTPHSIATILAQILVPQAVQNVTVYDPAAGTGTLVLALAHEIGENNCTVYTQDISQKANEFMRLNLILNGLVHSLPNVVHDDTLVSPRHLNARKDNIATFDYIASNPPFNMDFSETRDTLAGEAYQKRFFAGVPNIPNKKLDSCCGANFLSRRARCSSLALYSQKCKNPACLCRPVFHHSCSYLALSSVRRRPLSRLFRRACFPRSGHRQRQIHRCRAGGQPPQARRSSRPPAAQSRVHRRPSPQTPQSPH